MSKCNCPYHCTPGRLAESELQAENKALRKELDEVRNAGIGTLFELRKTQGSRDELLEALKLSDNHRKPYPSLCISKEWSVSDVIQKAEAQKEKETK